MIIRRRSKTCVCVANNMGVMCDPMLFLRRSVYVVFPLMHYIACSCHRLTYHHRPWCARFQSAFILVFSISDVTYTSILPSTQSSRCLSNLQQLTCIFPSRIPYLPIMLSHRLTGIIVHSWYTLSIYKLFLLLIFRFMFDHSFYSKH
jgi:hypothetical protein